MMDDLNRVVIVGGGIGGVATAGALRSGGYDGEVVLIDRGEFPYDRPPLSKEYLAGSRDLKEIALQEPGWYADNRVELVSSSAVVALSPADDAVSLTLHDGREITADRAVLAPGGRAALPPIVGLEDARDAGRVHVLREHTDADALRAALVPGARLLVVGGGLIGAETASTALRLGCEVVLVDPLAPPLAAAAGSSVATWLHDQHAARGIQTVTGTVRSLQVSADGVAVQLAHEADARFFDVVLVGVGMVPDTTLAEAAGLDVDRGVARGRPAGDQPSTRPRCRRCRPSTGPPPHGALGGGPARRSARGGNHPRQAGAGRHRTLVVDRPSRPSRRGRGGDAGARRRSPRS